jgi:hypothetical protein
LKSTTAVVATAISDIVNCHYIEHVSLLHQTQIRMRQLCALGNMKLLEASKLGWAAKIAMQEDIASEG